LDRLHVILSNRQIDLASSNLHFPCFLVSPGQLNPRIGKIPVGKGTSIDKIDLALFFLPQAILISSLWKGAWIQ
jgi:hypothetical protein